MWPARAQSTAPGLGTSAIFTPYSAWPVKRGRSPSLILGRRTTAKATGATVNDNSQVEERRQSGRHCSVSQPEARIEALRAISDALRLASRRPSAENNSAISTEGWLQSDAQQGLPAQNTEPDSAVHSHGRRRGRPSGLASWNKGMHMPLTTRSKISVAQKARWQDQDLNLRNTQSQKQKGKVPWNKGKSASLETRQKMSAAKRLSVFPRATTGRMSRSHRGLTHSPETCALISNRLSGRLKSPEHKAAIAAGQRRRAAALGMMKGPRGLSPPKDCGDQAFTDLAELNDRSKTLPEAGDNMYAGGATPHTRAKKKLAHRPARNEAVVEEFVGQLRQFRALQQELAPWTEAFRARTGRKPRVEDVELTGIDWLVEKFKDYMRMRDRLLSESQILRTKLEGGPSLEPCISSYKEKMNANMANGAMSEGAMRMAKALQYRRSHSTGHDSSTAQERDCSAAEQLQLNGHNATIASKAGEASASQQEEQLQGIKGMTQPQSSTAPSAQSTPSKAHKRNGAQSTPGKKQTPSMDDVRNPSHLAGASPRVKAAMLAALQYKKKQEKTAGIEST